MQKHPQIQQFGIPLELKSRLQMFIIRKVEVNSCGKYHKELYVLLHKEAGGHLNYKKVQKKCPIYLYSC